MARLWVCRYTQAWGCMCMCCSSGGAPPAATVKRSRLRGQGGWLAHLSRVGAQATAPVRSLCRWHIGSSFPCLCPGQLPAGPVSVGRHPWSGSPARTGARLLFEEGGTPGESDAREVLLTSSGGWVSGWVEFQVTPLQAPPPPGGWGVQPVSPAISPSPPSQHLPADLLRPGTYRTRQSFPPGLANRSPTGDSTHARPIHNLAVEWPHSGDGDVVGYMGSKRARNGIFGFFLGKSHFKFVGEKPHLSLICIFFCIFQVTSGPSQHPFPFPFPAGRLRKPRH